MVDKQRDPFVSPRVFAATTMPLALLLLAAGLLFAQVLRMRTAAKWVEHTEESIALCADTERRIHQQHAAVLARLIGTSDIQKELTAEAGVSEALRSIERHVADNEGQSDQVRTVRRLYRVWTKYASGLQPAPSLIAETDQLEQFLEPVVEGLQTLEREERRLRGIRSKKLSEVTVVTFYVALPLLLLLSLAVGIYSRRQILKLGKDFSVALAGQEAARATIQLQSWVRERLVKLVSATSDEATLSVVGSRFLDELLSSTGAVMGAFFFHDAGRWVRRAGSGLSGEAPESFAESEGLLGQAAKATQSVHIKGVPSDYLLARSSTGQSSIRELVFIPCHHEDRVLAIIELGFFEPPNERAASLISQAGESMGVSVAVTRKRDFQRKLLRESKIQAEALQSQQEELRVTNEELASQSEALKIAHAQLEERKEELEATNSNLVKQRDALAAAQEALATRALDLRRANRYKSEFLASMSHELRTPLNSCLILSKALVDNKSGNLTDEQVQYAETIHSSGKDLLELINDVLDLSKIEAGAVEIENASISLAELLRPVIRITEPLAKERGLELFVDVQQPDARIVTDALRVQQVLKNLLSNACKFTKHGNVTLCATLEHEVASFAVQDTGIGIPVDKLEAIFEAFRQADGSTSRNYGGTGLGLTISRDLATRLGGRILVHSEVGKGSLFTLELPTTPPHENPHAVDPTTSLLDAVEQRVQADSDRPSSLMPLAGATAYAAGTESTAHSSSPSVAPRSHESNPVVLLIQSDEGLNERMASMARSWAFDCVVANDAATGVELAGAVHPRAIVVEESLVDQAGVSVIAQLTRDPRTRDIPVHIISASADVSAAFPLGAVGYLKKPIDEAVLSDALQALLERAAHRPRILIVEDDLAHQEALKALLGDKGVDVELAGTVREALAALKERTFLCVVLDLNLPDASGVELLKTIARDDIYSFPSVVVYTGQELSSEQEQQLRRYSDAIILKGGRSEDRLLDELTMFLHEVDSAIQPSERKAQLRPRSNESALRGKRVLLVEDDVRNVYALTSVLEKQGVDVSVARNGIEALQVLSNDTGLELVLMDIMMPEMDGLEAMRRIRAGASDVRDIPIIALTAKAMRDDREACLSAGANDYVTKPIDVERLLSLIRIWLKPS